MIKFENIFYFLKEKDFINNDFYFKIFNRNLKINKNMVNLKFAIYNGKYFIPVKIDEKKLGNLIGSFSFSRCILLKNTKKKYKKKKKK